MKGGVFMAKYDGPSYYKKSNSNRKSFTGKIHSKTDKKVSWTEEDDYFGNDYQEKIPKSVQTRADLQKEALDYMQTSPIFPDEKNKETSKSHFESVKQPKSLPSNHYYFRSKYIPASLQNLEGWKTSAINNEKLDEIQERLKKASKDYLLFGKNSVSQKHTPVTKKKNKFKSQEKTGNEIDPQLKERAEHVQEELGISHAKPSSGLHRSLSKIISEDQEVLKNGKSQLGSLFSKEE